jgi:protein-S-isoprenylcysteine O-methyltransferase Ste14
VKRLSRFGVGPRLFVPVVLFVAAAVYATRAWPEACVLHWLPESASRTVAVILAAIGLLMWGIAAVRVMRAYNCDQLVSTGMYSMVRHPMYAGWIVFILPGLALWYRSWPLLLPPVLAWAIFKALIRTEDRYLEERYGQPYRDYRARVNELVPEPWKWRAR